MVKMTTAKKFPSEEYRQTKINEGRTKVNESVSSFRGAFNSVLDEVVNPVYEKIEQIYKNAVTVGDFAKAEIVVQKLLAEMVDIMDKTLKRLVS